MEEYQKFHSGTSDAYKFMGCHYVGNGQYSFTVWAPNAKKVCVAGDFNEWKPDKDKLKNVDGVWTTILTANEYDRYKYVIYTGWGRKFYKADPYAFFNETRGQTNSIVYDQKQYQWNDEEWRNRKVNLYSSPLNIYEVNLGSWKRHEDGSFYTYKENADELIPYVKDMGYTHIELMPINEYPLDDSWGYQATGYFSATSRFGEPNDLKYFIDVCHKNNIGVILDWVPAHFCKDEFGLIDFDGGHCYEYEDPLKKEHASWGTRVFDYGRGEVISFLLSSALYWTNVYHFDGLRVDAVASMLYLDYDRKEWRPNVYGGKENIEAIAFFRRLSVEFFRDNPNGLLVAEESTAFGGVTAPADCGGLGFNYKWNMGWMNDALSYMSTDFCDRGYKHDMMTFAMVYAYSENYILPLSHDEVVYGKRSLIEKMPGKYEEKFAGLRTLIAFMMAHPGKKLTFMGTEIAQFNEWNFGRGLEWMLLDFEMHRKYNDFVKKVNHLYKENSPLYECDHKGNGFTWKVVSDRSGIIAFERIDEKGQKILCVYNFSVWGRDGYAINENNGKYTLILNSDSDAFGGNGIKVADEIIVTNNTLNVNIPPLSAQYYAFAEYDGKNIQMKTTSTHNNITGVNANKKTATKKKAVIPVNQSEK